MGFLYANATAAATSVLGMMLLEKLHQLSLQEVKFYNDQRVLNEQLLRVRRAGCLRVAVCQEQCALGICKGLSVSCDSLIAWLSTR